MIWQFFLLAAAAMALVFGLTALGARLAGEQRMRRLAPWVRAFAFVPLIVVMLVTR
jgi:hypothetical protein